MSRTRRGRGIVAEAIKVLVIFWAGLLVGVSFLATPIKFRAESLSLAEALDVGRATFHAMSWVEIGLAVVLVALVGIAFSSEGLSQLVVGLAGVVVLLVLLQAVWLLPALDERVAEIIAGSDPERSLLHTVYIGAEVVKLGALVALAVVVGRR
jgi:hypothetical protein